VQIINLINLFSQPFTECQKIPTEFSINLTACQDCESAAFCFSTFAFEIGFVA